MTTDRRKGTIRMLERRIILGIEDTPDLPKGKDKRSIKDRRQGDAVYWKARYDAMEAVAKKLNLYVKGALAELRENSVADGGAGEFDERPFVIAVNEARAKFAALTKEANG